MRSPKVFLVDGLRPKNKRKTVNTRTMDIEIEKIVADSAPDYRIGFLTANVRNGSTPEKLTAAIKEYADEITQTMEITDINRRPGIAGTRQVYKKLGKDPNRYRPSHEQMMRRILKGLGLYTVNALVDSGNLLSLKSGYSVGVFDADRIQGDTLRVGRGEEGEPYVGIGRGPLNIVGLPVVRDAAGGIGTPTSDNERTKVGLDTRRIVVTIHMFATDMDPVDTLELAKELFTEYCSADITDCRIVHI